MPEPTKAELTAKIDELTAENERLKSGEQAFDPLSLLTPEALSGIKPMLRTIKDGTLYFPYLSQNDAKKMRHLGGFLEQLLSASEARL